MRKFLTFMVCLTATVTLVLGAAAHEDKSHDATADASQPAEVKLENLLHHELAGVENTEVIISRVTLPPHTTLPKHTHPGEEFAYLIEGAVTLWTEDGEELLSGAGAVSMVPLNKLHTAITGDEGAVLVVFRVHEKGKPERTVVK